MRDSCGKSHSKIKKYFYYNEYNKDNFPFISDYDELTLLDLLEGRKSIVDIIPLFVPYALIFILAIICIGVYISICACSRKPKCFLKKDNIHTNRTRFICLMVFFGFALCIIVLGIVLIVYISYAEKDFNGTICSLLMLQYDLINGQGFLAKNRIYKPYWYGSTKIGESIDNINTLLDNLKQTCDNYVDDIGTALRDATNTGLDLEASLESSYLYFKNKDISGTSPTGLQTNTIPIYTSNLGPKENNETYTGRVYEGYNKNFKYILNDIITPVYGLCNIISGGGGADLTSGLGSFESVIENLNTMLDNLSSTITEYIMNFSHYIINFGYKINFSLFIVITVAIAIECILYLVYYFRPFSLLKCNIYIFIHIINITLILCIIYNGLFGILSLLFGNLADIVDAAFSKENLVSEEPRLIGEGTEIQKLARCLRGDGDLFDEFVTDQVKTILNPLTILYTLYTPVKKVEEKINNDEGTNKYNSLIALDEVISELDNMKEDFLLSTTKETSFDNDITTMLDEMTQYTMAGRRYQRGCAQATYHIWTTTSRHCPIIQADNNIITGQCKYLTDYYTPDNPTDGADEAALIYNQACPLINTDNFPDVKTAVKNYILSFTEYRKNNEELINKILEGVPSESIVGFTALKTNFQTNFIDKIKDILSLINTEITGSVHDLFSELLNDTIKDSSTINPTTFNLFSWMNCSAIGQDYNATLSTLKHNLTNEMRVITYCSLVCEFLLIANLYIMVGLAKNLRDKIFEINDAKNVSHSSDNIEELQINSVKETKNDKEDDEIFAIKNKKKFEVADNIDEKRGVDINEGLDKNGNRIIHPAVVSINGTDGRCIFENGENAHKELEAINNKNNNNINTNNNMKDKETEVNSAIKKNTLKINENKNVEIKNLPKKKKQIFDDSDNENDDDSSRKTKKKTKNMQVNKSNKTLDIKKSSKNLIKYKDKKSGSSSISSSVSFGK